MHSMPAASIRLIDTCAHAAGYAQLGGGDRTAHVTADDRGNVVVTAGAPYTVPGSSPMASSIRVLWTCKCTLLSPSSLSCGGMVGCLSGPPVRRSGAVEKQSTGHSLEFAVREGVAVVVGGETHLLKTGLETRFEPLMQASRTFGC